MGGGGVGFSGFRGKNLTRERAKFRGLSTPSELCFGTSAF